MELLKRELEKGVLFPCLIHDGVNYVETTLRRLHILTKGTEYGGGYYRCTETDCLQISSSTSKSGIWNYIYRNGYLRWISGRDYDKDHEYDIDLRELARSFGYAV